MVRKAHRGEAAGTSSHSLEILNLLILKPVDFDAIVIFLNV